MVSSLNNLVKGNRLFGKTETSCPAVGNRFMNVLACGQDHPAGSVLGRLLLLYSIERTRRPMRGDDYSRKNTAVYMIMVSLGLESQYPSNRTSGS